MGTSDFAAVNLRKILDSDFYQIVSVFTQPDKPKGRGYKLEASPVKQLALKYNLDVMQPSTLKDDDVVKIIKSLEPDIIIVIAYGKILTRQILDIPKYGCINIHGSLLPKYRGAAPIQWSVINGEKYAGVTSMFMDEGLDTGDIIAQDKILIDPDETSGELMERLSIVSARTLMKTLEMIKDKTVTRKPQDESQVSLAPMLEKSLSFISFDKPARDLHNIIRGLNPWPVAKVNYNKKNIKIYKSKVIDESGFVGAPGEIVNEDRFIVACSEGSIEFLEIQLEGKKRMMSKDFLKGNKIKRGDIINNIYLEN